MFKKQQKNRGLMKNSEGENANRWKKPDHEEPCGRVRTLAFIQSLIGNHWRLLRRGDII